jgi:ribonuclease HI
MKMNLLLALVLIGLAFPASAQNTPDASAPVPGSLERTLIASSESVCGALKNKNLGVLKALLAGDFEQVGSEGRLHDNQDFLADAAEGNLTDCSFYNFRMLSVDENAALLTYDAVIHEAEGDDGLAPQYQHFSDLWVRQGDQWRLRFRQATPRRPID